MKRFLLISALTVLALGAACSPETPTPTPTPTTTGSSVPPWDPEPAPSEASTQAADYAEILEAARASVEPSLGATSWQGAIGSPVDGVCGYRFVDEGDFEQELGQIDVDGLQPALESALEPHGFGDGELGATAGGEVWITLHRSDGAELQFRLKNQARLVLLVPLAAAQCPDLADDAA